jgi:uncharacterized membrane protein required for colicin V production
MNIFDIVIVVLMAVVVILSAKKGFVASCLDTFSMAISAFSSYVLCPTVSNKLYDMFIRDLVKTEFSQALDDMSSTLSVQEKVSGMLLSLPETAVKLAQSMGVDVNNLSASIVSSVGSSEEAFIDMVVDTFAYKIMITLTEIVVFIALFILITILVRFVSSFFSHNLEKIPVIGQFDTVLGLAFGVVKAVVLLFAASVVLYIVAQTADPGSPLESLEASKIYMFMNEYNPIIGVLKG